MAFPGGLIRGGTRPTCRNLAKYIHMRAHAALLTLLASRPPPPALRPVLLAKADPFRPQKPPLEPMIINAVQELLRGKDSQTVAEQAVQAPSRQPQRLLCPHALTPTRSLFAAAQGRPGLSARG